MAKGAAKGHEEINLLLSEPVTVMESFINANYGVDFPELARRARHKNIAHAGHKTRDAG